MGNGILYLPLNQTFANADLMLLQWYPAHGVSQAGEFAGRWDSPSFSYDSAGVSVHPTVSGWWVFEIRGFTGSLGAFGLFAQFHSSGAGG
jgi:hypothetical protein